MRLLERKILIEWIEHNKNPMISEDMIGLLFSQKGIEKDSYLKQFETKEPTHEIEEPKEEETHD